jgi:hypothetical protein
MAFACVSSTPATIRLQEGERLLARHLSWPSYQAITVAQISVIQNSDTRRDRLAALVVLMEILLIEPLAFLRLVSALARKIAGKVPAHTHGKRKASCSPDPNSNLQRSRILWSPHYLVQH